MVSCRHPACAGTAEPRAEGTGSLVLNGIHRLSAARGVEGVVPVAGRDQSRQATVRVNECLRGIAQFVAASPSNGDAAPFTETAGGAEGLGLRLGLRRELLGLRRALGTGTLENRSQSTGRRCQRPPNPVMVMPWTKKRWAKMKSTRMGASMIVLTANTISQCCTSKSLNILTPTARGNLSMVLR